MFKDKCSCKFCKERRANEKYFVLMKREIAIDRSEGKTIGRRCPKCGKHLVIASVTKEQLIAKCEKCGTQAVFRNV